MYSREIYCIIYSPLYTLFKHTYILKSYTTECTIPVSQVLLSSDQSKV